MFKKINRENKKGFTLAELLIVVAIIGVLVAISIPIFTAQLEKSREATDAANIRSAYAVVQAAALTEESADDIKKNDVEGLIAYTEPSTTAGAVKYQAVITLKQKQNGWQGTQPTIGGMEVAADDKPVADGKATIVYDETTGKTTLSFKSGS
jgi:type IV pilus assembly protein PilA